MFVLSISLCDDIILHLSIGICSVQVLPVSQTVSAYGIAFFPCQISGKGQPLWVINGTELYPDELIPDHTTNISGLIVFARPEYNNTIYQCRFITLFINEIGLMELDIITSLDAVLVVIENGKDK